MKLQDAQIILIPDHNFSNFLNNTCKVASNDTHWADRWHKQINNSIIVPPPKGDDLDTIFTIWVNNIIKAIKSAQKPVILVCHGYATNAALNTLQKLAKKDKDKIKGGFWVTPAIYKEINKDKLSFPTFIISSSNSPLMEQEKAEDLAKKLGAFFIDAGNSGRIDEESGHGPWPEGLMLFSQFMSKV